MCGKSYAGQKAEIGAWRNQYGGRADRSRPLGFGTEGMAPGAQVAAALVVILAVALSGLFFASIGVWWVVTTYGWIAFPAFGALARGAADLSAARTSVADREADLLRALERNGELTSVRAAMEASMPVSEADRMLRELAEAGHLEVRVRGGGLAYALWEAPALDRGAG